LLVRGFKEVRDTFVQEVKRMMCIIIYSILSPRNPHQRFSY
jgi:hypothetical protein